jgi:hypothetical protein
MRKAFPLVLAVLLVPATAQAGTVSAVSDAGGSFHIQFTAAAGETNVVIARYGSDRITITDHGATLTAGAGCSRVYDDQTAVCPAASVWVDLADGDDEVIVTCDPDGLCGPAVLQGGPGADTLTGGDRNDVITGDDGDDDLSSGGGRDVLFGGAGDDIFEAYEGDARPQISCGDGVDELLPGALIGLDCETILQSFNGYAAKMRLHEDGLKISVHFARCRYQLRFGRSQWRNTTLIPKGWSSVTLPLPAPGGSAQPLYWREACPRKHRRANLLFRVHLPG